MRRWGQSAIAVLKIPKILGIKLRSYPRDFVIKIALEFRTYIQQAAMHEAEDHRGGEVRPPHVGALEALHRSGLLRPNFDLTIEIGIGGGEEGSSPKHAPPYLPPFWENKNDRALA